MGDLTYGLTIPEIIVQDQTTVATSGTALGLTASTTPVKSVTVKALSGNTALVYVGHSSVTSTNGFELSAGEALSLDIHDVSTVFVDAAANAQSVCWFAVK